jgi:NAD(P)-dependent dehydrogenase (short-subunit alcohol dehydrogenase family)
MLKTGRGRIVMLASQAALVGLDGQAAYAASKAGVLGMLRSMAVEWGPRE